MSKIVWMLAILVFAASCTGSKTSTVTSSEVAQIDLSGSDDFNEVEVDMESDESLLSLDSGLSEPATEQTTDTTTEQAIEPQTALESSSELDVQPTLDTQPEITAETKTEVGEGVGSYMVQKNETLMMISFKLYGDYSNWRSLAEMNRKHVKNGIVMAGVKIKYKKPSEEFNWQPQGNPYLIKNGDTLGTISNDVYGTQKKWKSIWDNNRPLIKNPNQIFAGFTIYYLDQGSVASSASSKLEL